MNFTIFQGDVLTGLQRLSDGSVDCVVTSPPYWGLRDYGTAKWEGGKADCSHKGRPFSTKANINKNCGTGTDFKNQEDREFFRKVCGLCGAIRKDKQIGMEQTPEEYVSKLVVVFREVRRVLKDRGTCWLNLGDSYAGSGRGRDANGIWNLGKGGSKQETNKGSITGRLINPDSLNKKTIEAGAIGNAWVKPPIGFKNKDLVGIPWRVAFALQADGWWLRQDIIWAKPNPMPESVTDRCTKSHEYIFLLTKKADYYFANNAIKEPISSGYAHDKRPHGILRQRFYENSKYVKFGMIEYNNTEFPKNGRAENRNKRSVWTMTTKSYPEAHFATFPPELPEICIKAGCPREGVVLDPFAGSGTTLMVARELGRSGIGIELNPVYVNLIKKRLNWNIGFDVHFNEEIV